MINITAKTWNYYDRKEGGEPLYTGNYYVSAPLINPIKGLWSDDEPQTEVIFEILRIHQIGEALTKLRDDPNVDYQATDEEIIKLWNKTIAEHNERQELFIKKFSIERKDYYENLCGGYGTFFFTEDMIQAQTEKALRINHPIVGLQWIPKKCTYTPDTEKYQEYLKKNSVTEKEIYVTAYSYNSFKNL